MAHFNAITYNMHGYNQGETMVKFLCDVKKPDVIFLQEHWLSPDRIHELCSLSSEYIFMVYLL